ncbi:MAG: DUF2321 domain-containing protein [Planctomycetes bacterium]|nr:DUF2321 domain-containing protein [Planctomycetota bacterium]
MSEEWYQSALVCGNGHVINDDVEGQPSRNRSFCEECGEPAIKACVHCAKAIRGARFYHTDRDMDLRASGFGLPGGRKCTYSGPPKYCHACGKPFPWMVAAIAAAEEFADTLISLTVEERDSLKASLPDIVAETPRTQVAASRFRNLASKAGGAALGVFQRILAGILCEAAKRQIWPQP